MNNSTHRPLDLPLMSFATDDELARIKAGHQWKTETRAATALLKNDSLRAVLVALHQGARIAEHRAEGPITVAVIDGVIRFRAAGEERILKRGGLIALGDGIAHEVEALEESAFVVTVIQKHKHI